MNEHLTLDQIAEASAARRLGDAPPATLADHIADCAACRAAVDKADACLDAAAALGAEDEEAGECPDELELAAFASERGSPEVGAHLLQCAACRTAVQAAREADSPSAGASRKWIWNVLPGGLAVAALVAVLILPARQTLLDPYGITVGVYEGGVVRGEDDIVDEFDVGLNLEAPREVYLLVLDHGGELTLIANQRIEGQHTFGRYELMPSDAEGEDARRTHAVVLIAETDIIEDIGKLDVPTIAPAEADDACALLTDLDCACVVRALAE